MRPNVQADDEEDPMGFFTKFLNSGDEGFATKFFPLCGPGEMPYIKVIPKKRKVFCSESIMSSKTIPLDEISNISFEKTGSEGGLIHLFSETTTLLTMKSKLSPDETSIAECLKFIKSIRKK